MKNIKRGEIYYADLSPVIGSEQGGMRPVLILQNDIGNRFSPTTIVIPLTSIQKKKAQPTHVTIDCDFLESESTLLLEQVRTIDKTRLSDYLGQISKEDMERVETAMAVSLGFGGTDHDRKRKRRCSESLSLLQHQYASPSAVHAADYRGRIQPHPPPHNRAL